MQLIVVVLDVVRFLIRRIQVQLQIRERAAAPHILDKALIAPLLADLRLRGVVVLHQVEDVSVGVVCGRFPELAPIPAAVSHVAAVVGYEAILVIDVLLRLRAEAKEGLEV